MKKSIFFFTMILVLSSCEVLQVESDDLPIMYISEPKELTPTGVTFFGDVEESELIVETIGFCWNENPMPTIDDSKIIFNVDADYLFSHRIENLEPDTEYYFRTHGTTSQGIGYSEDMIIRTPPVATPPCDIEESQMVFGSQQIDCSNLGIDIVGQEYKISCGGQGSRIELLFKKLPDTRVHQSVFISALNETSPLAYVTGSFPMPGFSSSIFGNIQYSAESGQPIYIEKLGTEKYRIEFCDFKMNAMNNSSVNFIFNGHFVTE